MSDAEAVTAFLIVLLAAAALPPFRLLVVLLVTAYILGPSPSKAADPYLCTLWAREAVRIEIETSADPAVMSAGSAKIIALAERAFHRCLLFETEQPALPDVQERDTAAWARSMLRHVQVPQGTAPAGDEPEQESPRFSCQSPSGCLPVGSPEWKDYCRQTWRTYRSSDDTVVRAGTGGRRVLCPA